MSEPAPLLEWGASTSGSGAPARLPASISRYFPTGLSTPREAEAAGIALIPQELDLFAELTVAEPLFVGLQRSRTRWGGTDWPRDGNRPLPKGNR